MKAHRASKKASKGCERARFTVLKQAVKELGIRAIDRRTLLGRALSQWRGQLVGDLGGPEAISVHQETILDLAVRTKLMVDSIDAWLLTQPSLVNHRKRALLPVVLQRQQLADSLARYMTTLGLERKAMPVPALAQYLEEKYGDNLKTKGDLQK